MDPYVVLNISVCATDDEVKRAYQKELLKWHPDKCKSHAATNQFLKIQEAWSMIGNAEKKKLHDVTSSSAKQFRASDVISLGEFSLVNEMYSYPCRCSGVYEISMDDVNEGYNVVECTDCSLSLSIEMEESGN